MQLRDERAEAFLSLEKPIGEAFAGVLLNYLRFVEPDDTDSNNRRWAMAEYWADFLGDVSKISLFVAPGAEYNLQKCKHYVVDMAGNAIAALMQVCGSLDDFASLIENRTCSPNPKYEIMIREHHAKLELQAREMAAILGDSEDAKRSAAAYIAARNRSMEEQLAEYSYYQAELAGKLIDN